MPVSTSVTSLLTEAERAQIFDSIRSGGPLKANYQSWVIEWLGEEFTEEGFEQHQTRFPSKAAQAF